MDISIIILNYKSKGYTLNCIKSIKEADFEGLYYEIIVVDNNSGESMREILSWQYPKVKFIQNRVNTGMGQGNNAGIEKAQGDYIVIMNPDTIALEDTFIVLHEFMEKNKKVGIVGPKQLNPNKSTQNSCFRWHRLITPVYRRTPLGKLKLAKKELNRFLMKDYDHEMEKKVDWLLGSFMFIRAEAMKQIGGFDKRYFLYFEDTDLCREMQDKGWQVVYYPEAKIIHNHIRQSAEAKWWKFFFNSLARAHISSWLKYIKKWGIK
jgi:GT2 family glycosyltransferase